MNKLNVNIAGINFNNPILMASGTFGYGLNYLNFFPLSKIGGFSTKGTSLEPKMGNLTPRIAETPMGMLNSVGLENPGLSFFNNNVLPKIQNQTKIIVNIAENSISNFVKATERLNETNVHMLELNISCPNVNKDGVNFSSSADQTFSVVSAVTKISKKPVIVKLSPNVTSIVEIAKAAENAGANALSLINTPLGMRINIETKKPILHNNYGGLSGPAIFPIAVRMVNQVYNAVSIPIIGIGGISSHKDVLEMMIAGASAVQIGSAIFSNPMAPIEILTDLEQWVNSHKIDNISNLVGSVNLN